MVATEQQRLTDFSANHKNLMDELRESNLPAEVLLDRERKKMIEMEMMGKELALRRKQEKLERREKATFDRRREVEQAYHHVVPSFEFNGPTPLEDMSGYLNQVREVSDAGVAGGYLKQIGCCRALLDAYQDLFDC